MNEFRLAICLGTGLLFCMTAAAIYDFRKVSQSTLSKFATLICFIVLSSIGILPILLAWHVNDIPPRAGIPAPPLHWYRGQL